MKIVNGVKSSEFDLL